MNVDTKLEALVGAAAFDSCGYSGPRHVTPLPHRFIYRAVLPGGGCTNLLKILLTNACVNDCAYCVNQIDRDCPRFAFKPEELAKVFMEMHAKKMVDGLFLSSGIAGNASRTMESMIKTVEILRRSYQFKDYIHLKILPGATFDLVQTACQLADRVSVNIEAPTAHHLAKLSSKKNLYSGIFEPMRWVKRITDADTRIAPSGQITQFVVGAAGETDGDILRTTDAMYREIALRRTYFSAYSPVSGSRLEGVPPAPGMREHRLPGRLVVAGLRLYD